MPISRVSGRHRKQHNVDTPATAQRTRFSPQLPPGRHTTPLWSAGTVRAAGSRAHGRTERTSAARRRPRRPHRLSGRMRRSAAIVSTVFRPAACAEARLMFSSCRAGRLACVTPAGLTTATVVRRCRCRRRRRYARNRRGPHAARTPRGKLGLPILGSALLYRSGADARIVSMVNTDGLES